MLLSLTVTATHSGAASSSDFVSANSGINSAFVATHSAEQSGGNVTGLVAKLDISLSLVQKAETENATNPSQATTELQNATQIANQVSTLAPAIAQAGFQARQTLYVESIGGAVGILILGGLIYIYGARNVSPNLVPSLQKSLDKEWRRKCWIRKLTVEF